MYVLIFTVRANSKFLVSSKHVSGGLLVNCNALIQIRLKGRDGNNADIITRYYRYRAANRVILIHITVQVTSIQVGEL